MKRSFLFLALCFGIVYPCFSQATDSAKHVNEYTLHHYFIISAGDKINAFFNDKPLSIETISDFNEYVLHNIKTLKDSWVVVTGKPKVGTFDEVIKTLNRNKFKHVTKNISKD